MSMKIGKTKVCHHMALCLPIVLTACAVDFFSDRGVVYNEETQRQRDQLILTNIVRAGVGRSLQFTELSTVSGTASQSISLAGTFPFAVHRPVGVGQFNTFSPTLGLSGGPTFSIANLNSKEFYSAITAPLSTQIVANYLLEGDVSSRVLLPLVISDIIIDTNGAPTRIHSSIEDSQNFFNALYDLLAAGLTAERLDKPTAESPPLTDEDARSSRLLASLASGAAAGNTTLDLKRYDTAPPSPKQRDPNLSTSERQRLKAQKRSSYYRLEKKGQQFRLCFDPTVVTAALAALHKTLPAQLNLPFAGQVWLQKKNLCGSSSTEGDSGNDIKATEAVSFQTRSVASIFVFLGNAARSGQALEVWKDPSGLEKWIIFAISRQRPPGPSIEAFVDGQEYFVSIDPAGLDQSSRVLQLLSELIALNSSAKDLPAPNVITVISP